MPRATRRRRLPSPDPPRSPASAELLTRGTPGAVSPGERWSPSSGPGIAQVAPGPLNVTCGTRGAEVLHVSASLGHRGGVSAATWAAVPRQADCRTSEPRRSGPQLVFTHQPRRGGLGCVLGARGPDAPIPPRALPCLSVALTCQWGTQASAVSGRSSPQGVL